MKIGIVCEGVTDFHAIEQYLGAALRHRGVNPNFIALQPNPDNTSGGGWTHVLTWLMRNSPAMRQPFFESGLFASSSKLSGLDYIIIQLDTDIIPEEGFRKFVSDHKYTLGNPVEITERAEEIVNTLTHFSCLNEVSEPLKSKHICAPIAEASEAWCIAADPEFEGNPENLSGKLLTNEFGKSFSRFYKQPLQTEYLNINKNAKSRSRYCRGTSENHLLVLRCSLFAALVDKFPINV